MMVRRTVLVLGTLAALCTIVPPVVNGRDSDAMEFTTDSLATVKKNVAEGKAILVDVRDLVEWNSGHVRGAVLLPWRELQGKQGEQLLLAKLPKDKIIYTYCAVGYRSSRAGKIITQYKYQVRPLKPGFDELARAGFATEQK